MIEREDILPIDSDTLDTITLDMSSLPPYLTANSNSITGPYPSLNVGAAGGTGTYGSLPGSSGSSYVYTTNSTSPWQNLTMTNNIQPSSLNVKGDAEFEGKVKVNGQDLGEFMETISKRLAILVPDPAKLEHFEALKKAYNHYKTLEALCELPKEEKE
jgi:hypothetical protein